LKAEATPFNEWFANCLDCMSDLPDNIEVVWGWVRSEDNAAYIASRTDTVPNALVEGTEWQDGPAYLKSTESEWPIRLEEMRKQ
jgi:hypothetical protein